MAAENGGFVGKLNKMASRRADFDFRISAAARTHFSHGVLCSILISLHFVDPVRFAKSIAISFRADSGAISNAAKSAPHIFSGALPPLFSL